MEAWLAFFCEDDPDVIVTLTQKYPQFRKYYEQIYELCRNTEKVMDMFSKELLELDRNTVQYMIDEQQETIDKQQETIDALEKLCQDQKDTIQYLNDTIKGLQDMLKEQTALIRDLNKELTQLRESLKA